MKLTKAQKALLDEVIENGIVGVHGEYKPALKLIQLELVNHRVVDYGMIELKPAT